MRDEEQRAGLAEIVDPVEALALEGGVADRQGLVDHQDPRPRRGRRSRRPGACACPSKCFTGWSMYSPMPANSAIESNLRRTSLRFSPSTAPPIRTFSRPDSSMSKVEPSASTGAMRPLTRSSPWLGSVMPQITCSRVDLPQPFAAQDADALALLHFEADVAQHPEGLEIRFPPAEQDLLQPVVAMSVELERLAEVLGLDDDLRGRRR